jgi:hypothetical protein
MFTSMTPEQIVNSNFNVNFRLSKSKSAQVQFVNVQHDSKLIQVVVKDSERVCFEIRPLGTGENQREGNDCTISINGRKGDEKTELFLAMKKFQDTNTEFVEKAIDFGKALTSAISQKNENKRTEQVSSTVSEFKGLTIVIVEKTQFNKFKDHLQMINQTYGLQILFVKALNIFHTVTSSSDGKYDTMKFKIKTTGPMQTKMSYQKVDGTRGDTVNFNERDVHQYLKKGSMIKFKWGPPSICFSAAGISVMYGTMKNIVIVQQSQLQSDGFSELFDTPLAQAPVQQSSEQSDRNVHSQEEKEKEKEEQTQEQEEDDFLGM